FDPRAGYVESGRAVATLVDHAKALGVELREQARVIDLMENAPGVLLEDRQPRNNRGSRRLSESIRGDGVVIATGAWTPHLLPSTKDFFRASGQPVFHFRP